MAHLIDEMIDASVIFGSFYYVGDIFENLVRLAIFCVLVSSFFRFMGKVAEIFLYWRRW